MVVASLRLRSAFVAGLLLFVCGTSLPVGSAHAEPWRLDDAIPTNLVSLSVTQRTRYEYLSEQFRVVRVGGPSDQVVVLRTLVDGKVSPMKGITIGAEMQDSRAYVTEDTFLTTTIVNSVELIRAYADLRAEDVFGGDLRVTGGRMTMDVGSRRFVARNRFRNTINGFTGVDIEWQSHGETRTTYRAFWTAPQFRRPTAQDQPALQDNTIEIDRESVDQQFWGLFAASETTSGLGLELYIFGLHERDNSERSTPNRNLFTSGVRLFRLPRVSQLDYEFEGALQWGESRANRSSTQNLDHFAYFLHTAGGYTFDAPWQPRLVIQWDYASGDKNPNDDKNGRFDTLFGARRFEFGPTGIYGPFARSNLNTVGMRLQVKPAKKWSSFFAYRAFWLAQKRDRWTTTGVVDPTGQSGSFLGDQIEVRVRWNPLPGNLRLEVGYAHLFRGEFMKKAPNAVATKDSDYVYTQAVLKF